MKARVRVWLKQTEWPDDLAHHQGFTTAMVPNANTKCTDGTDVYQHCDYNSWQEGRDGSAGNPSYAIITSRSYHEGIVQSALVDGSVRTISESIDRGVWQRLGARSGGEGVGEC